MIHLRSLPKLVALTIGILVLSGCASQAGPTPTPTTGTIEGIVYVGESTTPSVNVDVALMTSEFEDVATAKSDAKGHFLFADLPPGTYIVTAFVQDKCVVMDMGKPVDLTAGMVVVRDIKLPCQP
jgi:hypothetical protein